MYNSENLLFAVEETLGKVRVSGEDDLDRLLGCIRTVRGIRRELEKKSKEVGPNASRHEDQCEPEETSADSLCGT